MVELKQYTIAEVQKTKGTGETVIILNDKVYNVTKFLNEHPGGEEILMDNAAKDATENFNDVGHSQEALDLMKEYLVGEIVESERKKKPLKKGWVAGYNKKSENEKYVKGPGVPFYTLMAVMILLLALYLYNML
ncbi:hypothetical protein M0804_001956 [Polistes exclamans]|nr:hypothetical protein M0804_001956 [Polistes exclamans]